MRRAPDSLVDLRTGPHHAKQLFDRNAITEGSQKHLSFSGFVEVEKGLGLKPPPRRQETVSVPPRG